MTTDRRRRPHAAARARVVVAGLSASLTAVLVGGMAAADEPPTKATAVTGAPDRFGTTVPAPVLTRPSSSPVTRSHAS